MKVSFQERGFKIVFSFDAVESGPIKRVPSLAEKENFVPILVFVISPFHEQIKRKSFGHNEIYQYFIHLPWIIKIKITGFKLFGFIKIDAMISFWIFDWLIDWFWPHLNPSGVILYPEVPLTFMPTFFCVVYWKFFVHVYMISSIPIKSK